MSSLEKECVSCCHLSKYVIIISLIIAFITFSVKTTATEKERGLLVNLTRSAVRSVWFEIEKIVADPIFYTTFAIIILILLVLVTLRKCFIIRRRQQHQRQLDVFDRRTENNQVIIEEILDSPESLSVQHHPITTITPFDTYSVGSCTPTKIVQTNSNYATSRSRSDDIIRMSDVSGESLSTFNNFQDAKKNSHHSQEGIFGIGASLV